MSAGAFPIVGAGLGSGASPRIHSLLIKPASALCNLDCSYCFYLDRDADPYKDLPARRMSLDTLERLVDSYLFYSYPQSVFAFQGGEPTLVGLAFYQKLVELQKRYGRNGHAISNSLQTNGILLNEDWCALFREFHWLIGLSLDGPEPIHDQYRINRGGQGTWRAVLRAAELMKKHAVEFNILCVVNEANVGRARELYRFWRSLGVDNVQYIPLAEFDGQGNRLPFAVTPEQYGKFLLETFELWWPDRRRMRIRCFDNLAEALAGQKPGACTLHETCDSYVVVEYNGDVYPCDFFVESRWKLGNLLEDSWPELGRRQKRYQFATRKTLPHPECAACEYEQICHGGCPKFRHGPRGNFEDLDYFCPAYKMVFARTVGPLKQELAKLFGNQAHARR